VPLKTAAPGLSAEVVFLKNRTLSPAVSQFGGCARDVAKSLGR
jgi:hypothetical protein